MPPINRLFWAIFSHYYRNTPAGMVCAFGRGGFVIYILIGLCGDFCGNAIKTINDAIDLERRYKHDALIF